MRILALVLPLSMMTACGAQQSLYTNATTASQAVPKNEFILKLVQKKSSSASGLPSVTPKYGITRLTLPLYPGATSTSQKFPLAFDETPISWYVRTGKADYIASGDAGQLEAWYKQHMGTDGYHQTGSGSTGNFKTGESAMGLVFQPVHQAAGHQVEVDISFENLSGGKTAVEYWGTDLVLPPRPATNYLPGNVIRVDGEMTVYGSKVAKYRVDIVDHDAIQRLVSVCNSLAKVVQGINPGGPMIWGTADLNFHTSTGKSISVNVDTDGASVGDVGLQDGNGTLWKTLESIMGVHGTN